SVSAAEAACASRGCPLFIVPSEHGGTLRRCGWCTFVHRIRGLSPPWPPGRFATVRPMTSDGTPLVEATGVSRIFGECEAQVHALEDVSVAFPAGRFTAIMGPSGSGKSTLMHILAGLDRPTPGSVVLDGTELGRLDDRALPEVRREKVGFVFQSFNLLPVLTAEENI